MIAFAGISFVDRLSSNPVVVDRLSSIELNPQAERIEGIPPAIAIQGKNLVKTSRATVGTMTEIAGFCKLLFAKIAQLSCHTCKKTVRRDIIPSRDGSAVVITFPYHVDGASPAEVVRYLAGLGFHRVYRHGAVVSLEEGLHRRPTDCSLSWAG